MSRAVIVIDRIAILLVSLTLLAGGIYAVLWGWGDAVDIPERLQTTAVATVTEQPWWPLALGSLGLILVLLGLRWLAAHIPDRAPSTLRLSGSDNTGSLTIRTQAVGEAAADQLKQTPGVVSAHARVIRDRGQTVLSMRCTVSPDADLVVIGRAADAVTSNVTHVTGRDDLRCRIQLSANRNG